jgi:hypothetical protein
MNRLEEGFTPLTGGLDAVARLAALSSQTFCMALCRCKALCDESALNWDESGGKTPLVENVANTKALAAEVDSL